MFEYLYLIFKNRFEEKLYGDFSHFNYWSNQVSNPDGDTPVYPAVFMEIMPVSHNYIQPRVLENVLSINFYVAFEDVGSWRYGDTSLPYSLKKTDLLNKVHLAFDGISKDTLLNNPRYANLTEYDEYYDFGIVDKTDTQKVQSFKSIEVYKLTYNLRFIDFSAHRDQYKYITFKTITGITSNVISGDTVMSHITFSPSTTGSTQPPYWEYWVAGYSSGLSYASETWISSFEIMSFS